MNWAPAYAGATGAVVVHGLQAAFKNQYAISVNNAAAAGHRAGWSKTGAINGGIAACAPGKVCTQVGRPENNASAHRLAAPYSGSLNALFAPVADSGSHGGVGKRRANPATSRPTTAENPAGAATHA